MPKMEGFGQFANLRGAWQETGGGVFEGGGVDTPMHTMLIVIGLDFFLNFILIFLLYESAQCQCHFG